MLFGYQIHPTSRIGISWFFPKHLIMGEYSRIGHLNVCKGLSLVVLKKYSIIAKGNWITGAPKECNFHFVDQNDRLPQLILEEHVGISSRHIFDCTDSVTIGKFSTVGGFRSQFLTHTIDLKDCRQSSKPIQIGEYCFIGTDCVLLGGSALPDYSILGAKSLLNKQHRETYTLYAGVPAKPVKKCAGEYRYFSRKAGYVN